MFVATCSSSLLLRVTTVISFAIAIIVQPVTQGQSKIKVQLSDDREQLEVQWMGQTHTIDAKTLSANVFNALDCSKLEIVEQLPLSGQRFIGTPTIDLDSGNIAVGVLLSECVETQQSAVFVIKPQSQNLTIDLIQFPGSRSLPNNFSTYAIKDLLGLQYWDELLLIRQGDAAGNQSLLIYKNTQTPTAEYRGCIPLEIIEGAGLCPKSSQSN